MIFKPFIFNIFMSKVIVTGGAGFIGSHLTDALVLLDYEVHVVDTFINGTKEYLNPKVKYHNVDIRDLESLKKIFFGAEFIFHLAALPRVQYSIQNPVLTNEVNVTGTQNVLIAAKDSGVKKVIYSASSSAYGNQDKMPLTESMVPDPISPYALQKFIGEKLCVLFYKVYSLPCVSLRYFNVYGPRMDPDGSYPLAIGKFLKQRLRGEAMTITGDGEQTRDFTHVRDVVRANLLAAQINNVGKGEIINIGAGRNVSINYIAKLISGPITYISTRLEPKNTLADNSLAESLLGWKPAIKLEDGINELKSLWGII